MLDTKAAAKEIAAESDPDRMPLWALDRGTRKGSVRFDVPLRQSSEVLHILRWMARELPEIADRIERERDEGRRLFVAQYELRAIGEKVARRRSRR
ncbi:MAG TPA: hypothetical protein VMU81_22625 [Acetobacteraceae bacterium]|nr:hypothetical protein [Acetobacteraceae bacterium]